MEFPNSNSTNTLAMPPNYLQRNKLLAMILIPLALIIILISSASIFGKLFAAPKLIADEIPLGYRIFQELCGFIGAIAGLMSGFSALTNSLNVNKFFAAGDQGAAIAASEKAQKHGKNLPLLIGILALLLIVKIAQTFFSESRF